MRIRRVLRVDLEENALICRCRTLEIVEHLAGEAEVEALDDGVLNAVYVIALTYRSRKDVTVNFVPDESGKSKEHSN